MNFLKVFFIFIAIGLMNLLPVNSCPDITRPHEYQCNMYYKCLEVTKNQYIWMAMRCDEDLIYDHTLRKCILPDDNWDCQLQDNTILMNNLPENNSMVNEEQAKYATNGSLIQNLNFTWNENNDLHFEHDDGSGNGSDVNYFSEPEDLDRNNKTYRLQESAVSVEKSSKTENIDTGLTAHLQRLSQLVDGLSKTYQGDKIAASELRPDQLNAFLTLFNIRNQFYSIATHTNKEPLEQRQKFMRPLIYHQEQEEMRIPIVTNMHNEMLNNPNNNFESNYLPHPLGLGLLDDFNDKDEDLLEDDFNYVPPIPNRTLQTILELSNQLLDSNGLPKVIPYPTQHPINPFKDNNQNTFPIDSDFENKYPNTFNMPTFDQNVGIYKPSKMERRNPTHTTTIIHNNLIPFHIFSSGANDRPLVDSYGQQLDTYPPLKTTLDHLADYTITSPKSNIDGSNNYNRFTLFDEHPVPDIISTFYTPSLHLNDQNVNTIFQLKTDPPRKLPKWHNYYSNTAHNQYSSHTDGYQVTTASPPHLMQIPNKSYSESNRLVTNGSRRAELNIVQNHQIADPHSGSQIVNIGGNFVSLNTLLNSIRHLFTEKNATLPPNVQVINCASGIRQANVSDCTRYYVCSKTTNKILSYSCPPYTAFNKESRICDSNTYVMCSNYQSPMLGTYTISDNKRLQMLGLQALQDLKYMKSFLAPPNKDSKNTYDRINSLANGKKSNKTKSNLKKDTVTTTISPIHIGQKYNCQEGDKIPDPTSSSNYFVCFKTPQDEEIKHLRLSCTKGLIFCSHTNVCTLPIRCHQPQSIHF